MTIQVPADVAEIRRVFSLQRAFQYSAKNSTAASTPAVSARSVRASNEKPITKNL